MQNDDGGRLFRFGDVMAWVARATGAVVNYDDVAGFTYRVPELRLAKHDRYHHGPFCSQAKRHGFQPRCTANKQASIAKARLQREPFWGHCPFGLWDLAYPVLLDDDLIGIFYLGGFRARDRQPALPDVETAVDLPLITSAKRRELLHYGRFLADHCRLIIDAWRAQGGELGKQRPDDFYISNARSYIDSHYDEDIAITDLAALLQVHPDHLGKMIKAGTGRSFRRLLQDQRIERAMVLLATRRYSITQVAYMVGFNDSNYFSTVFRKHSGCSPRSYVDQITAK